MKAKRTEAVKRGMNHMGCMNGMCCCMSFCGMPNFIRYMDHV